MSCRVNRNSEGDIVNVLAENGKESQLYNKLVEKMLPEDALMKYAESLTPNFQAYMDQKQLARDENGELANISHIYQKESDPIFFELSGNTYGSPNVINTNNTVDGIDISFLQELKNDEIMNISNSIRAVRSNMEQESDPVKLDKLRQRLADLTRQRQLAYDDRKLIKDIDSFTATYDYIYAQILGIEEQIYEMDGANRVAVKQLDLSDVMRLKTLIEFLVQIDDTTKDSPLFDRTIMTNEARLHDLNELRQMAREYSLVIDNMWYNKFVNAANGIIDTPGEYLTEGKLKAPIEDVGWGNLMFRDIRKYDDVIAQAMRRIVTRSEYDALEEFYKEKDKLAELVKAASPHMDDETFAQTDSQGRYTDSMIHRYTSEYLEQQEKFYEALEHTLVSFNQGEKADFRAFLQGNDSMYMTVDVVMAGGASLERSIDLMSQHIPRKEVEAAVDQMRKAEELFLQLKDRLDSEFDYLRRKAGGPDPLLEARYGIELDMLINNHSPRAFEYFIEGRKMRTYSNSDNEFTGANVVKFYIPTNKKDYDSKFEKISNNEAVLNLWTYIVERNRQVRNIMPSSKRSILTDNFLPVMKQGVLENFEFSLSGIRKILPEVNSAYAKLVKSENVQLDRLTGKPKAYVPAVVFGRSEGSIINEAKLRHAENNFQGDLNELVKDVRDEAARKRSWNIEALMNMYNLQSISYDHKLRSQDVVRSLMALSSRRNVLEVNKIGRPLVIDGKPQYKQGESDIHKAIENYAYKTFFNLSTEKDFGDFSNAIQGILPEALYTDEAKRAKKILEENPNMDEKEQKMYKKIIEKGTKKAFASQGIRSVAALVHLRGLGWNFFSGLSTVLFGSITNQIEAGRYYSEEAFNISMKECLGSIASFWSRGKASTDASRKIRAAMEWGDFLSDSTSELGDQVRTNSKLGKTLGSVGPYVIEKRSEYLTQAPVMAAIMRDTMLTLTNSNGETVEVSMYECFDSNFKWKRDEPMPHTQIARAKDDIKDVIERLHGNYNTKAPIYGKNNAIVQLALTFRTWMIEGIANRWEIEKFDGAIKGRWRSYGDFVKSQFGKGKPAISLIEMVGKLAAETLRRMTNGYISMATLGYARNTIKSKIFENTTMSETDVRNMHSNIKELVFLLNMFVLSYLLTIMLEGGGDETEKKALRFMINQLSRLETDATLYINPNEFEKLNKNIIPAFTAFSAFTDIIGALKKGVIEDDWELQSGVYAGWNRPLKETLEFMPFANQYMRFESTTRQLFDK
jgi:hypothetical protein